MTSDDNALISIRPHYAEAILSGTKTVEVRRRIPAISIGTCLWIYATQPCSAVVGSAIVDQVIEGTPAEIWEVCMDRVAVDRCSYDAYFSGTDRALGLVLSNVTRRQPIKIEQLKQMRERFHPPRVLARLSHQETSQLAKMAFVLS